MRPDIPVKTTLTILTFGALMLLPQAVPSLKNYVSIEPKSAIAVLKFPLKQTTAQALVDPLASPSNLSQTLTQGLMDKAPKNLSDPGHVLDHFYAALLKGEGVQIIHYGDSPTTADLITADARALFQREFGDGGVGFVLLARPWAWYNHRGVEMSASNWKIDVAGNSSLKDGLNGLGAVSFRGAPGAVARWKVKSAHQSVEIAFLTEPQGGEFAVEADGNSIGAGSSVPTPGAEAFTPGFASFDIPPGTTEITLKVTGGSVRFYGADFRKGSGVVYSSLGINGANVTLLSKAFNEAHWAAELRHYKPDLIIVNYGTNESGFPNFVDTTWGREMRRAVARLQAAVPEASILLMSPMDRGAKGATGEIDTIPAMPRLVSTEAKIAADTGVAFFNTFEAMGGAGTMGRWYTSEPRLVGSDYIHPMPAGARIVGELLFSALREGFNQFKLQELKQKVAEQSDGAARGGEPTALMRILPAIELTLVVALTATAQTTAVPSKTPAKKSIKKPAVKPAVKPVVKKSIVKKPAPAPPRSSVSAATRAEAQEGVVEKISKGAQLPVENAAALIPFFEQLYRHQRGELEGPLRALHYGDSHVAADEWTGDIRERLQQTFGDGGSGYTLAGRPWNTYRRLDVKSGSTSGWHSDGLVGRTGDGIYGLGGVSMTASSPRQSVYLVAEGQQFELYYLQQPGGGAIQVYDNGMPVERISTDGETAPSYFHYETEPGSHRLEAETLERAPVRLFGWVSEKPSGVTYEALGINGAEASMMLNWNNAVLKSNIERRDPALIVLSYGTNEAGHKDWTLETYRDMYSRLIERLRADAPAATILVIGPPDRSIRVRNKGWVTLDNIDMIVEAERQAALAQGCAFWDQRAKMGGKGSMREWVLAGMAQNDHVHLTAPGYHMIGDAMFRDLMSEYDLFVKAREALAVAPNLERP